MNVQIEVPQEILDSAQLTPEDVRLELAIHLYEQGRLGIGKAHELAQRSLWEFRQVLAARRIAPHYEVPELNEDIETLRDLDLL